MTRVGLGAGCAAAVLAVAGLAAGRMTTTTSTDAAPGAVAPATADGAQLFHSKGCAACHSGPASTARFEVAPSLADAGSWAADREPGVSATDYLAESMLVPGAFISPAFRGSVGPMTGMPDLGLSPAEVAALIDYLLHP